jgi:hypothetical protein
MVLAQVPLSRFTRVPTRNSYVEWLRRVGNLCADLVVCDMATQVIAVIHVQSASSASSERVQRRYERMARVLKAEKIAFHTWIEGAFPSPEGARTALLREVPAVQAAPAQPTQPGDLDEPDRNAGVEERGDAPPSTWYSELDSSALPLDPRSPRGTTHR